MVHTSGQPEGRKPGRYTKGTYRVDTPEQQEKFRLDMNKEYEDNAREGNAKYEKEFKEGDKVYYDVFPDGTNIKGKVIRIVGKEDIFANVDRGHLGIRAEGKHAKWFKKHGVSVTLPMTHADYVRKRTGTKEDDYRR